MAKDEDIGQRRGRLSQILSEKGFITLAELSVALGVSESTVRRDLEALEDRGVARRTHGGAVYLGDSASSRLAFSDRETTAAAEKRAIASAVADLVPPGGSLLLDGGTTCVRVAEQLRGRSLSVVTNSVPIASLLSSDADIELTVVGGYLYPRTGVTLGPTARTQLESLHAGLLVFSCAGATEAGTFNINQMVADLDRWMIESADEVILAIDSTKLGRRAVVELCGWDRIDVVVTDDNAGPQHREWLDKLGARVIYAPMKT